MGLNGSLARSVAIATFAFCVILVAALVGEVTGRRWESLLRDSLEQGYWDGLFTNIGVALMVIALVIAALSALADNPSRRFFALAALFAAAFAYDDFFRFHENQIEVVVYVVYAMAFVLLYIVAARQRNRLLIWPLLVILACFAMSILIDLFWNFVPSLGPLEHGRWSIRVLIEEGTKFGGIVLFAVTVLGERWLQLVGSVQTNSDGSHKQSKDTSRA